MAELLTGCFLYFLGRFLFLLFVYLPSLPSCAVAASFFGSASTRSRVFRGASPEREVTEEWVSWRLRVSLGRVKSGRARTACRAAIIVWLLDGDDDDAAAASFSSSSDFHLRAVPLAPPSPFFSARLHCLMLAGEKRGESVVRDPPSKRPLV